MALPAAIASDLQAILDGAAFVLQSPLALAAVLVTCVLVEMRQAREAVLRTIVFAAVTAASGVWSPAAPSQTLVAAALLVLGLAAAVGRPAAGPFAWPAVVAGGLAAGWAAGMQTASWQEALGGSLALGALAISLWLGLFRLHAAPAPVPAVLSVGRRVIGAWIAAVGALLLALSMRGGIP